MMDADPARGSGQRPTVAVRRHVRRSTRLAGLLTLFAVALADRRRLLGREPDRCRRGRHRVDDADHRFVADRRLDRRRRHQPRSDQRAARSGTCDRRWRPVRRRWTSGWSRPRRWPCRWPSGSFRPASPLRRPSTCTDGQTQAVTWLDPAGNVGLAGPSTSLKRRPRRNGLVGASTSRRRRPRWKPTARPAQPCRARRLRGHRPAVHGTGDAVHRRRCRAERNRCAVVDDRSPSPNGADLHVHRRHGPDTNPTSTAASRPRLDRRSTGVSEPSAGPRRHPEACRLRFRSPPVLRPSITVEPR